MITFCRMTKMSASEAGKLGALAAAKTIELNYQKRIDDYNSNPNLCKYCETPIPYNKRRNDYCSHSCAATHTLSFREVKRVKKQIIQFDDCLFCQSPLIEKGQSKYCSRDCMMSFWWQEAKNEIILNQKDTSYAHRVAKKYLIKLNQGKCQICGLSEWNKQPMPLVLDHINGHSEDGSLSNLRVICNNCDALTDTYKSKNKGNGREKRRQRYKEGKSW